MKKTFIIVCFFFLCLCYVSAVLAKSVDFINFDGGNFSDKITNVIDTGKKMLATYGTNLYLQDELNLSILSKHNHHDFNCMVNNIFFEARGEDIYGKIMVADVVINRAKGNNLPSLCSVIYQHHQFSWTNGQTHGLSRAQKAALMSAKAHTQGARYGACIMAPTGHTAVSLKASGWPCIALS